MAIRRCQEFSLQVAIKKIIGEREREKKKREREREEKEIKKQARTSKGYKGSRREDKIR